MARTIRLTPRQADLLEEASEAMGVKDPHGDADDYGVRRLKDLDADDAQMVLDFIDNEKSEMESMATWNSEGPHQIAFAELQFRNKVRALQWKIERHFGFSYPDIFPGRD